MEIWNWDKERDSLILVSEEVKITKSEQCHMDIFLLLWVLQKKIRLSSQPTIIKRDKDTEAAKQWGHRWVTDEQEIQANHNLCEFTYFPISSTISPYESNETTHQPSIKATFQFQFLVLFPPLTSLWILFLPFLQVLSLLWYPAVALNLPCNSS